MLRSFALPSLATVVAVLSSGVVAGAPEEAPHIHTSRPDARILPTPRGDEAFQFVIFGDRTGGPAEGIKVLAQAVDEVNLLDPDLVMTVGDLVNGYNQTDVWMKQMEEYRATMNHLKRPWFPVAGNHDIYWRRDAQHPEEKPSREHEEHYEKHFGPLWYWFEHKRCGFLVLFSDEGHPDGRPRDFGDAEQQQISRTQLNWIAAELEKMKPLRHVFVFLHHPFWWGERYPGSNWDEVHRLLARNGNVRAVIAGHIHQMRYDGVRDGIAYYALAATGASLIPGMEYRYFGLLHQYNMVTVRDDGFSMASVPVGSVFDPRQFTPERWADVEAARFTLHDIVSPPLEVQADGTATGHIRVALTNTCSLALDAVIVAKGDPAWRFAPDHGHASIEPGRFQIFEFECRRSPTNGLAGFTAPELELRFDVLTPEARLAMPIWSRPAPVRLAAPRSGWPAVRQNQVVALNGTNACLEIERKQGPLPDGPFTVEAWVKGARDTNGAIVSNLRVGGFSLEVAGTPQFRVQTDDASVDPSRAANLKPPVVVHAAKPLVPGRWTHLAGVFDGTRITLFVNGHPAGFTNVTGARLASDKSLYIGARPNGAFNTHNFSSPFIYWRGSADDVRISRGARYGAEFKPESQLTRDAATLLFFSFDRRVGPLFPGDGSGPVHATARGDVHLVAEAR